MKIRLLLLIICLWQTSPINATMWACHVLRINNGVWCMMGNPIFANDSLHQNFLNFLPSDRSWSTANPYGYTGIWEITDGKLYLRDVKIQKKDSIGRWNTESVKGLEDHFTAYLTPKGIFASWLSSQLRIGRGKIVHDDYMGFRYNKEKECVLTLHNGCLIAERTYQNYKRPGIDLLTKGKSEIICLFPWKDFPELKGKRIFLTLGNIEVTPDGCFSDCRIQITHQGKSITDPPLPEAFKETLRQIYPWEYLYIDGSPRLRSFTIPINCPAD